MPKKQVKKWFSAYRKVYDKRVHYGVVLFGIKIQFSHKFRWLSQGRFFNCLHARQIPLCFENFFWNLKKFPVSSAFYTNHSDVCQTPKVGIVLQGPINTAYNFTLETLKMYKNIFLSGNDKVVLIVSTWEDEDPKQIACIKQLGVQVVQSPVCDGGIGNVNKQVVTTQAGLRRAKELGCEYVIKTRTDQRFYTTNILEFLFNILKTFPLDKDISQLKSRLVALSFNTFKFRLYGVSDMFLFGHIDDVMNYWNVPLDVYRPDFCGRTDYENFKANFGETCICREFVRRIGGKVSKDLKDTYWAYYKYFCFVDRETVNLFWPKHTNQESRWDSFTNRALEEVSFRDWLNLFYRKGVNTEWEQETDFDMPKLD